MTDERETLHALLQYQRDSLVRKATGVDEQAARRVLVGSGTTLLWLMKHMARAESLWVALRFAGQKVDPPDDGVRDDDRLVIAVEVYRDIWTRTDSLVAACRVSTNSVGTSAMRHRSIFVGS